MKFDVPNPKPDVDTDGNLERSYTTFFTLLARGIVGRSQYGPTAERPTKLVEPGLPFFDTTLGYAIWVKSVNPIVWVNATGGVV